MSTLNARPAKLDIAAYRGDTVSVTCTFRDANDVAINLTGRTFAAQIKDTIGGTLIASFTIDTTNAATGVLVLTIPAATTSAWTWQTARWDLQETEGAVITTLLAGTVTLDGQVTT